MFCSNCGHENPEGASFCRGCGMILKTISSQTESVVFSSNIESESQEPEIKSEVLDNRNEPHTEKTAITLEVEMTPATAPVTEVKTVMPLTEAATAVDPEPVSASVVETTPTTSPVREILHDQPPVQTDSANLAEPDFATASIKEHKISEGGYPTPEPSISFPESNDSSEQTQGILPFSEHLKNILKSSIHPVTGPSEIVSQYNGIGNSLFLTGVSVLVVSAIAITTSLLIDLISIFSYSDEYEGLIGELIARDFFFPFITYAIRTFGCAGLLFLAGLIIKEKWSFSRLLTISSLAVVPAFAVYELLVGILYNFALYYIGTAVNTACQIYYFIMLYEGMVYETKLTKNKKAFILFIVFTIVAFVSNFFSNY
jgi:hypothetical protein